MHHVQSDLYQDSPGCSDEGLSGSLSLLPHIVGVVVKLRRIARELGMGDAERTYVHVPVRLNVHSKYTVV